jgi:Methyltransferase domain
MSTLYVQYGCGICAPVEWTNFDASPTLIFERVPVLGKLYSKNEFRFPPNVRYGNIARGLPIRENSVDGLYASHVLEHLPLEDCYKALANSLNILKPGAPFRLIVPDLEERARRYVADRSSDAAHIFMRSLAIGGVRRPTGLVGRLSQIFGGSLHQWMWDERSLTSALLETGFHNVRRCEFGDSEDPMFHLVEHEGRFWTDGFKELALEARK